MPISAPAATSSDHGFMVSAEFERVYREQSTAVYQSAFRILGNNADAEDVLQTVFLRFLRRDASLGSIDQPQHYLRRAAVNAALDILRSRQQSSTSLDDLTQPPSQNATQELSSRLRDALRQIEPAWAELFLLRHLEGLSNKELAQMLGVTQTWVAVTLFRTRQKLQKAIQLTAPER